MPRLMPLKSTTSEGATQAPPPIPTLVGEGTPAASSQLPVAAVPVAPAQASVATPAPIASLDASRKSRSRGRRKRPLSREAVLSKGGDRTDRLAVWLTPEEREDLALLSLAENMTDSSYGRDLILKHLERNREAIRRLRDLRRSFSVSA
jgi:hypothetical protein